MRGKTVNHLFRIGSNGSVFPHFSVLVYWIMFALAIKILTAWRLGLL